MSDHLHWDPDTDHLLYAESPAAIAERGGNVVQLEGVINNLILVSDTHYTGFTENCELGAELTGNIVVESGGHDIILEGCRIDLGSISLPDGGPTKRRITIRGNEFIRGRPGFFNNTEVSILVAGDSDGVVISQNFFHDGDYGIIAYSVARMRVEYNIFHNREQCGHINGPKQNCYVGFNRCTGLLRMGFEIQAHGGNTSDGLIVERNVIHSWRAVYNDSFGLSIVPDRGENVYIRNNYIRGVPDNYDGPWVRPNDPNARRMGMQIEAGFSSGAVEDNILSGGRHWFTGIVCSHPNMLVRGNRWWGTRPQFDDPSPGYITTENGPFGGGSYINVDNVVVSLNYDDMPAPEPMPPPDLPPVCEEDIPPPPVIDVEMSSIAAPNGTQGDVLQVVVVIRNRGTVPVPSSFFVVVLDLTDSTTIGSQIVANLGFNEVRTLTYFWNTAGASIGTHIIQGSFTLAGDVNPANNTKTTTAVIEEEPPPPLEVDIAVISITTTNGTQGDVLNVVVVIRNLSNGPVPGPISVELFDVTDNVVIDVQVTGAMALNETRTITFVWDTAEASIGVHTLRATVTVAEDVDLTNNVKTTTSTIEEDDIPPPEHGHLIHRCRQETAGCPGNCAACLTNITATTTDTPHDQSYPITNAPFGDPSCGWQTFPIDENQPAFAIDCSEGEWLAWQTGPRFATYTIQWRQPNLTGCPPAIADWGPPVINSTTHANPRLSTL